MTDSRYGSYIGRYGNESWELDALEPQVISGLITKNVLKYRDEVVYNEVKDREDKEREQLSAIAKLWDWITETVLDIIERNS